MSPSCLQAEWKEKMNEGPRWDADDSCDRVWTQTLTWQTDLNHGSSLSDIKDKKKF